MTKTKELERVLVWFLWHSRGEPHLVQYKNSKTLMIILRNEVVA